MTIRSTLRIRTRLRSLVHRIWPPKPKPLILMYHRIADEPIDPWGLAVSPARFEEQLRVLRRTRQPLPLAEFVRRLMGDTLPPEAVALTFDDGYVDNLSAGKPRLVAADVPATVFLATGYLDRLEAFWWDELAGLVLRENTRQTFELLIRGKPVLVDFGGKASARAVGAAPVASLKKRYAALWALWEALRPLADEERRQIMVDLWSILGRRDDGPSLGRAMTGEEVRALVADGLVTIGAHTITHPVLSALGGAACHREVAESKRTCEALVEAPVAAFAYPYGDFDAEVRETVKTAGFAYACSTRHGPALATSDVFALPRLLVRNVDGDTFERTLRSTSAAG